MFGYVWQPQVLALFMDDATAANSHRMTTEVYRNILSAQVQANGSTKFWPLQAWENFINTCIAHGGFLGCTKYVSKTRNKVVEYFDEKNILRCAQFECLSAFGALQLYPRQWIAYAHEH